MSDSLFREQIDKIVEVNNYSQFMDGCTYDVKQIILKHVRNINIANSNILDIRNYYKKYGQLFKIYEVLRPYIETQEVHFMFFFYLVERLNEYRYSPDGLKCYTHVLNEYFAAQERCNELLNDWNLARKCGYKTLDELIDYLKHHESKIYTYFKCKKIMEYTKIDLGIYFEVQNFIQTFIFLNQYKRQHDSNSKLLQIIDYAATRYDQTIKYFKSKDEIIEQKDRNRVRYDNDFNIWYVVYQKTDEEEEEYEEDLEDY